MLRAVAVIISAAVALLFLVSCGGRDTVAERSAAAYRDAVEKGVPIEDDHGGHGAHGDQAPGGSTLPATHEDHGAAGHGAAGAEHPAGHAAAGGGAHDAAQHGEAQQGEAAQHGAAQHGAVQHDAAQQGATQHGAQQGEMQHGDAQRGEMQHGEMQHDAAQHGQMHLDQSGSSEHGGHSVTSHSPDAHSAIPPGGLWGAVPGSVPARPAAAPALPMAPVPATNDEMKSLRPDSTLAPDPADTPAAISVQEAKKAAGGEGDPSAHTPDHSQHDTNEDARP